MKKMVSILIVVGVALALIACGGVMKGIGSYQILSTSSIDGVWVATTDAGETSTMTLEKNKTGSWDVPGSVITSIYGIQKDEGVGVVSGYCEFNYIETSTNYYLITISECTLTYENGNTETIPMSSAYYFKHVMADSIKLYDVNSKELATFTRVINTTTTA